MMKPILRKKNRGIMLIEPLEKGFFGLQDGDEYVHLGIHNHVLLWNSKEANDNKIGKVLWEYNVRRREEIINKFILSEYAEYLEYVKTISMLIELKKLAREYINAHTGDEIPLKRVYELPRKFIPHSKLRFS